MSNEYKDWQRDTFVEELQREIRILRVANTFLHKKLEATKLELARSTELKKNIGEAN